MPALFALLFSIVAIAGSLYLSLGLGLVACPLCFYQRTFAFALVGLLTAGLLLPDPRPGRLCVLALPLAVGGLGVAGYHTLLATNGKLECPPGIAEFGPAPAQSLAVFALITLSVVVGAVGEMKRDLRAILAVVVGLALGAGAVYGSLVANPAPSEPKEPYPSDQKVLTCRVPYRG